jgi:hypothetical protein
MQRTSAGSGHRRFAGDDRFQPALPCGLFAAPSGFHNSILSFQRTNSYPFKQRLRPVRTIAQPHFLFILFAICHDANYIPLPACVTFVLFLKDSRSEFVVQCKEWTLSRSMLRKFSQGDGAPKAVVQAFLRSRLSKKRIVATAMIAGPSARFRDIRPMVK